MTKSLWKWCAVSVGMFLLAGSAQAGYSVDVYVDNVFAYTVVDNMMGDDNPIAGDIRHEFLLSDVMNRWQAAGTIFAEGGLDGVPPVSTVVTDTLIEKIANVPLNNGVIDFVHHYAASGLQTHSASIDGVFDNTIDNEVRGASLLYSASVTNYDLGSFFTGLYAGPGPEPFMGDIGPVVTPTTIEHHMELLFYLDSLGDSIEMFNSAEIHTVPEPAGALLLVGLLGLRASRRGREGRRQR